MAFDGSAGDMDCEWLGDYIISILQSPVWSSPIEKFMDENCNIFEDEDENKLEYTECHNEYRLLVTDLFTAHLMEVSVTLEQFDWFLTHGLAQHQQLHRSLVEQLLCADDFLTFKAMMSKHNAELDRHALMALGSGGGGDSYENLASTGGAAAEGCEPDVGGISEHDDFKMILEQSALDEEARQASQRCEEANLEQAIALSLQVEEERLRQFEELPVMDAASEGALQVTWAAPNATFVSMPVQPRLTEQLDQSPGEEQTQWVNPSAGFVSMPYSSNVDESFSTMQEPVHDVAHGAGFVSMPYAHHIVEEPEETTHVEPQAPYIPQPAGFISMPYNHCIAPDEEEQLAEDTYYNAAEPSPPMTMPPAQCGFISMPFCHRFAPKLDAQEETAVTMAPAAEVPEVLTVEPMLATPSPIPSAAGFISAPRIARLPPRTPQAPVPAEALVPEEITQQIPAAVALQQVAMPVPVAQGQTLPPLSKQETVTEMRHTLSVQRGRAQRVLGKPSAAASASHGTRAWQAGTPGPSPSLQPPPVAAQPLSGPSEQERRQRAEFLKRQRDRLIQKRNQDRDRAVADHAQSHCGHYGSSAIDAFAIRQNHAPQGRHLVAELTSVSSDPSAAQPMPPAPELMRQALTRQLKQTLAKSSLGAGLDAQLSHLERIKRE